MATAPVLKHQKPALTHAAQVLGLQGVNVSTAVSVTARSTVAVPFLVTNKPVSSGFLIMTQTYSYDGVLHTESYVSDI